MPGANCGFASFIASAIVVAALLVLLVPFAIPGIAGPFMGNPLGEPFTLLTPFTARGLDART